MNKQPVTYMQTDPQWASEPYRVPGETATIGGSGCGPSCAAMLIETLTGQTYTPKDACAWSVAHGYKALNQGTYYSYFLPQFAAFGIDCIRLNTGNVYGHPNDPIHDKALALMMEGYYLIACMGKGLWTSSGHYVVAWWQDGTVRINDPASTRGDRINGDIQTFRSQVKYYWAVDARAYNQEDDMDIDKLIESMTGEQAYRLTQKAELYAKTLPEPAWSQTEGHWRRATEAGVVDGSSPERPMKRDEVIAVLGRKGLL